MMIATIVLIVGFQAYWLTKLYNDEWEGLKKETDVIFRETVYKLQVERFKKDTLTYRRISGSVPGDNLFNLETVNIVRKQRERKKEKKNDSAKMVITLPSELVPGKRLKLDEIAVSTDSIAGHAVKKILMFGETRPGSPVRLIFNSHGRDSMPLALVDSGKRRSFQRTIITTEPVHAAKQEQTIVRVSKGQKPRKRVAVHALRPDSNIKERHSNLQFMESTDGNASIRIFSNSKTLNDSLPLTQIDSAFRKDLTKSAIMLPFTVVKGDNKKAVPEPASNELKTRPASVGFMSPYYYQASFSKSRSFILARITPQIVLSLLLVTFTIGSFIVLYRNLMAQRKLADIKNEFISNITHELKTPIATVNVAIEAMKNFNALQNPERTQEYLDISASELQRLSLLVDKVLKLSMFEKKEIELKKEWFNIKDVVSEVMGTMKLQFEKTKAKVSLKASGNNFEVNADRLHITSVVYNLLDNALKYGRSNPAIDVEIKNEGDKICLSVSDNGIGISPEYKEKIFEKFFRVPANNTHNIKGYGLGLSYVCHIMQQHSGSIKVESEVGVGSRFIAQLPMP
jgi:signal transduction histidine kinase